ncbi:hypothetical protein HDU83_007694 [Entophlyctis luteolus]|nr:hypothetical protein HDU83_007694 [Entophlyctis luteolus]
MAAAPSSTASSDEALSRKMDQCLSNTLISTGLGLSTGILASVLFFRREYSSIVSSRVYIFYSFAGKTWPIAFSTGIAVGIASNDCSREFNPNVTLAHRLAKLEGMLPK